MFQADPMDLFENCYKTKKEFRWTLRALFWHNEHKGIWYLNKRAPSA